MNKTIRKILIFAAATMFSSNLLAYHGKDHSRDHGHQQSGEAAAHHVDRHGLDLSDEQLDRIRTIHEQQRAERRALVEQLHSAREALHSVAMAEPLDEAQLQARAEEFALVQTEIAVLHARTHAAIFQVLTPGQQEKAKSHQAERHDHHHHSYHRDHDHGAITK